MTTKTYLSQFSKIIRDISQNMRDVSESIRDCAANDLPEELQPAYAALAADLSALSSRGSLLERATREYVNERL